MSPHKSIKILHPVSALILLLGSFAFSQEARDLVNGNLIQFNDNGAWCWYQDERAIIDAAAGKLVVGSVASGSGAGGNNRTASIEATIYDLPTGALQRTRLYKAGYTDDHHAPGFLLRPDGKYLAVYAEHYDSWNSRYQIYAGTAWSGEKRFDWTTIPGGTDYTIAYSNIYYLSAENRTYCFARANHRTPNFIYSDNMGDTWSYGGEITTNSSSSYNKGYYKYWGNGVDRIDFIFTEQHPRDTTTSIYHGYIQGGKSYASDGTLADSDIYDLSYIPTFKRFTKVFANGTLINGVSMQRCWNTDLMRYDDGTIVTIITARTNQYTGGNDSSVNPDHAFIYCRFDGSAWSYTYLCQAGLKMYASEQDYTGLAAVCPNDPNTIYVSTRYDPRDDGDLKVREIFKGVTADHGANWTWTPITQKSVRDNFRPIVPAWDEANTALLWWRGTYTSAQSYDAAVVGIIDRTLEKAQKMHYVDATNANTTDAGGNAIPNTGPDANMGSVDGRWHERTGFGNGDFVLTSAEAGGENAPVLKTSVAPGKAGAYDVWVNFWGNPAADWRIKAGLDASRLQLFRSMACKQVQAGDHDSSLILAGSGNTFLYQAYLGRVTVAGGGMIEAYVDDEAIAAGQATTLSGDKVRTWYDGISCARVGSSTAVEAIENAPAVFALLPNYPNPFNPATTIAFALERDAMVNLAVYNIQGQLIANLLNRKMAAGRHSILWNTQDLPSGIYLCRFATERGTQLQRMTLLK